MRQIAWRGVRPRPVNAVFPDVSAAVDLRARIGLDVWVCVWVCVWVDARVDVSVCVWVCVGVDVWVDIA